MIFHGSAIQGIQKEFGELEILMESLGFAQWTWDYGHVVYDYKYTDPQTGVDYYLRIRGNVVGERALEHPRAVLVLEAPVFARHHFPHGLDAEAPIPPLLLTEVQAKVRDGERVLTGNENRASST